MLKRSAVRSSDEINDAHKLLINSRSRVNEFAVTESRPLSIRVDDLRTLLHGTPIK